MPDKKNTNKNRSGNAISHLELDNKISRIIFEKWPKFVTQKEIANELKVSQSLVSKRLSSWTNKKNVPLKMS
jgi:DNA-directed RNA polymerase specialized sigma subunit